MDGLKKLLALLTQHYEKMLLGLALLVLALTAVLLAMEKEKAAQDLEQYTVSVLRKKTHPYTNINWEPHQLALKQAAQPVTVDFSPPHNLLNPVKWQRRPDGTLLKIEKGTEVGPLALKVVKISPLYLQITVDKPSGGSGFFISVTREAHTNAALRKKLQTYVTPAGKDRLGTFVLKEVKGSGETAELLLELLDSGEMATVKVGQTYQRVDGYKVDFTYPPENRTFTERRLGDTLVLGGEEYNLVAITQNQVVLSARSNNKRTTLEYHAAP